MSTEWSWSSDAAEAPDDWAPLTTEIAANRMTVLVTDPAGSSADRLAAATAWLTDGGLERVAFVASGASGGEQVAALAVVGGAIDQLVLVSGDLTSTDLATLGEPPKLFVASTGDESGANAAAHMTEVAAGPGTTSCWSRGRTRARGSSTVRAASS